MHANLLAAQAKETKGQVVNIACADRITINGVIALINEFLETHVQPQYVPARAGDVKHSLADIGMAREVLGYVPPVAFREGLQQAIAWYKTNLL